MDKKTVCIAYKGLSYFQRMTNHHGTCTFSMLNVLDNHFKMIVEPLRRQGHTVVFALSTNDSPILGDIIERLKDVVYVSTHGEDQMDRARDVIENIPQDVTHCILTRCDVRFKCFLNEIPIRWDVMNFPWINKDRAFARNGDVVYVFPMTMRRHVKESFAQLHVYFKSRGEIPHGHGFYKRFFQRTAHPVHTMVSNMYNSNTDVTQNPIFILARSFDTRVGVHPKVAHAIKCIQDFLLKERT